MVLVLVVLVVLVASVGASAVVRLLRTGDRETGHRSTPAFFGAGASRIPLAAGALALLVVVLVATMALRGVGGSGRDEGVPPSTESLPEPPRSEPAEPGPAGQTPIAGPPAALRTVVLQAPGPGRSLAHLAVDQLEAGSVVRVTAAGFAPLEQGFVEQCVAALGLLPSCTGRFPVQFGEDGGADFQLLLGSSFAPGGCAYGEPTCWLRLVGSASGRVAEVLTVFGDSPRGAVSVAPRVGLGDRTTVTVSVTNFPPNRPATAMVCAPSGTYDVRRCGSPAPLVEFGVGPDGVGRATLEIRTGPAGLDRVPCGARHPCRVLVVAGDGFVAAAPVPLHFSLGPGASYDARQLAIGLSVALALAIAAFALARTTDWTKPTEASTPEVDAADLQTGATLDEIFGTDEEIDARDPIPS